jgi:hypothetical protein
VSDPSPPSALDVGVFLAELALLAALIYVGIALPPSVVGKVVAAIALPVVVGVAWGRWLAPRASRPLPHRTALALKIAIFALASVLLALAGPAWLAVVFFLITEVLVVTAERARWRRG